MAKMVDRICKNRSCKKSFQARAVDVRRGWGKFCCKSCKAVEQEGRTGQYAAHLRGADSMDIDYEGAGWDAHKGIF